MFLRIPPSLYHPRFRLLWLGLMISIAGSQMQFTALLWHIRELSTAETAALALGIIGLARLIPVVIFSLIGGVVADRRNRRTVMFITQSSMALMALILGLLTLSGQIALWHIYLLTALQAVAQAFDLPSRQAITPNLVPAEQLPNAFSMTSIAFQTGSIVGPALSGIVIASWGLSYTYFINAVSFLAVIYALIRMGEIPQTIDPAKQQTSGLQSIKEGIKFLSERPIIFSSMLLDFFATFFSSANTLMPIFAKDILHVSEIGYGWLSAGQSIGATAAALVISQMDQIRKQGPVLLASVVVFGVATILFGVSTVFIVSMIGLIFMGAADSVSVVIRNTIRQLRTPDHMRGRMVSMNQLFFMGGPQLGEIEAGIVAQLWGAPFAVISGGVGCILAVWWIAQRWPQLRAYQGEPAATPAAAD
ncbi:MAG: MFS transporter [Anaerolineales bacterium]|jgi:MFS family permease|nr:MFS transporter [Anaerolineales bacterium]